MEKKISVIIPVYNSEKYICQCLDSILSQSINELEVICIDDCSQDNSYRIMKEYADKDKRIMIIKNRQNKGQSFSRNKGIELATGKYIYFMDSDDYIKSEALEKLYDISETNKLDVLFYGSETIIDDVEEKYSFSDNPSIFPNYMDGKKYFIYSIKKNTMQVAPWCALYSRQYIVAKKIRFVPGIIDEDFLFYIESLFNAKRVSAIDDKLYFYRIHSNSTTVKRDDKHNLKRIYSTMVRLNKYRKYYKYIQDSEIACAFASFIKNDVKLIYRYYSDIDSFDMLYVNEHINEFMELGTYIGSFYNGYYTYKLPAETMCRIREARQVVIYGAGKVGRGLYKLLTERNIDVYCYAVSENVSKNEIEGIPVKNICEIDNMGDVIILIAVTPEKSHDMEVNAKECGFKNIIDTSKYV